ncbi:MAG: serine hydrolase domain-containing protein [bacterium]
MLLIIVQLFSCEDELTLDETMSLEEKIDVVIEPNTYFGKPGGIIIGIIQNGEKTIYSYGDAGLGYGAPKSNTIFEIASLTKTFTGILLNSMASDSILSMEDTITKFLPENVTPPTYNGEQIKLWHLATHTSGLPNSCNNFNPDESVFTNEDYYDFLNNISEQAFPFGNYTNGNELESLGTKAYYSNIGMALLGHILELASGEIYENLFDERIANILSMPDTKTYEEQSSEQKDRIAKAYSTEQKEVEINKNWGRSVGAGAYLSTMDDMLNYIEANINASPSHFPAINQSHEMLFSANNGSESGIGSAWFINIVNSDTIIHHSGASVHESYIKFNKSKKYGIIALSNTRNYKFIDNINKIFELLE